MSVEQDRDVWSEWLRLRRSGGSEEERQRVLEWLAPIRNEVLARADIRPGDVVLDVGCGDGLIGLAALELGARVIFSDVSQECLDDCRAVAGERASYHRAAATDLGDVEADVVTTRSVLIYVDDKCRAFDEFFRVLRPGGRLSIFEPINSFGADDRVRTCGFRDVDDEVAALLEKVVAASENPDAHHALIGFDERDLLADAEAAGFEEIRLTFVAEIKNEPPEWRSHDWDVFLDVAPNPLALTFREAMAAALTEEEAQRVTAALKPQVENGIGVTRRAHAYLSGRKPL